MIPAAVLHFWYGFFGLTNAYGLFGLANAFHNVHWVLRKNKCICLLHADYEGGNWKSRWASALYNRRICWRIHNFGLPCFQTDIHGWLFFIWGKFQLSFFYILAAA